MTTATATGTKRQVDALAWHLYQEALGWHANTPIGRQQVLQQWQRHRGVRAFYRKLARAALAYIVGVEQ